MTTKSKPANAPAKAPAKAPSKRFADELADACASTSVLLTRFLVGFDDSNATKQAPNLPNHVAWVLGHLSLTMHRATEKISGRETPPAYDPAPFAFGSKPTAERSAYPRFDELRRRFDDAFKGLADAIRAAGDDALADPVPWGQGSTTTKRDVAVRMVFHNGMHTGQIIDLRRALGMPKVVG